MEREHCLKILKRLVGCFMYTDKLEQDYVREEYIKLIKYIDYDTCNRAIDQMVLDGVKSLPLPMDIVESCRKIEQTDEENRKFVEGDQICLVCEGRGFVLHRKSNGNEYALYCDQCETGKEFKYDGRELKKDKTKYYSEPVSKYLDPETLKQQNMFKKHEIIPMPDYCKKALANFTRKFGMMPASKNAS